MKMPIVYVVSDPMTLKKHGLVDSIRTFEGPGWITKSGATKNTYKPTEAFVCVFFKGFIQASQYIMFFPVCR